MKLNSPIAKSFHESLTGTPHLLVVNWKERRLVATLKRTTITEKPQSPLDDSF